MSAVAPTAAPPSSSRSFVPTAATLAFDAASSSDRADATLLYNGVIYASASESDLAAPFSWISFLPGGGDGGGGKEGTILELGRGTPPALEVYKAAHKAAIDLAGQTVLPGLHDAHIHVLMTGRNFFQVNVQGSKSIQALQQTLKEGVQKIEREALAQAASSSAAAAASSDSSSSAVATDSNSTSSWVVGSGWEQDELGRYPSKEDLDQVVPDRPCLLWRVCSHICVVNSAALNVAGITAVTANPAGGAIDFERGILKETAVLLVQDFLRDSVEDTRKFIRKGLEICSGLGLAAVQTNDEGTWNVYKDLSAAGQLPLRVFLTIQHEEIGLEGRPKAREAHGQLLECHRVKLFADGALGAQTASLSMPYVVPHRCAAVHAHKHNDDDASASAAAPTSKDSDPAASSNFGILIHESSALASKVASAHAAGFRVELHAIGDRAAEEGLAAFESAGLGPADRPILTHCQVLRQDLVRRMADMGVVADVQPQFAVTDSKWASERLPEDLLKYSYCWRTLLESGVHVAGGSDAPIEVASPFWGMHAAIFRPLAQYPSSLDADSSTPLPALQPSEQWRPSECLSVSQALHLYTSGAAYACQREQQLGTLRVGAAADMTIVDRDVIRNPAELVRARATQVIVDGQMRR